MPARRTWAFASPPSAASRRHSSVGYSAEHAAGAAEGEPSGRMSSWGLPGASAGAGCASPASEVELSGDLAGCSAGSDGAASCPRAEERLPTAPETTASSNFPPAARNFLRYSV